MSQNEKSKNGLPYLLSILVICLILFLIGYNIKFIPYLTETFFPDADREPPSYGEVGDMYGIINALFSGIAMFLIIITVWLQKRDLKLQSQELKETRLEYETNRITNLIFNQIERIDSAIKDINIVYKYKTNSNVLHLREDQNFKGSNGIDFLNKNLTQEIIDIALNGNIDSDFAKGQDIILDNVFVLYDMTELLLNSLKVLEIQLNKTNLSKGQKDDLYFIFHKSIPKKINRIIFKINSYLSIYLNAKNRHRFREADIFKPTELFEISKAWIELEYNQYNNQ